MNPSKKTYISFLMFVFLMFGIAAFAYIGIFDLNNFLTMPNFVKAVVFVVIFFTLFLFAFFLINIKRGSSMKKKTVASAPTGIKRHQGGLLAVASRLSPSAVIDETSRHNVIYEKNGVPYINSDLVCDLAKKNNHRNLDSNFIKLVESVTGS